MKNLQKSLLRKTYANCRRKRPLIEGLEDRRLLAGDFGFASAFTATAGGLGFDIVADAAGNSYVTGEFQGTADFDPGDDVLNLVSDGDDDTFVAKLDVTGSLVWAKRMGGNLADGELVDAPANASFVPMLPTILG